MTTTMEITDKINQMETIYFKIYNQKRTTGKSTFKRLPEEVCGEFNGGFFKHEQDGFYYYLYENMELRTLLKRKVEIDNDVYLKNAYEINTGKFIYLQDNGDDEILTHYNFEFSHYNFHGVYYQEDGSVNI